MDDTTDTGSVDAVASSLIDMPADQRVEDAEIIEEDDAEPQYEAEADQADASDGTDDVPDDDVDEEPAADDEPAQATYTVKVDGKVKQVTLDELRRGYSGQTFIQQGMEQLAQAKKAVQSEYQTLQSEKQQLAEIMDQVRAGRGIVPPTPPAEEMLDRDPIGYMQAKLAYDKEVAEFQRVQYQYQQVQQQEQQRSEAQHNAYIQQQFEVLRQAIPEFADPKKAPAHRDRMVQAGQNYYGLDPQEVGAIQDARYLSILNDAMKYRDMQNARGEIDQKAQGARPVVKPGVKSNARSSQNKRAKETAVRMRQTGSVDDVAKFLLS